MYSSNKIKKEDNIVMNIDRNLIFELLF